MIELLELEKNNYVRFILIFVLRKHKSYYYFSDKDDWILENWQYFFIDGNKDYIDIALGNLNKDIISVEELRKEYKRLKNLGKIDIMTLHLPSLYIDFDNKLFYSRYIEQSLQDRTPEDWNSKFYDFLDLIPNEMIYWKFDI